MTRVARIHVVKSGRLGRLCKYQQNLSNVLAKLVVQGKKGGANTSAIRLYR
jgi:hypothetical protein